MADSALFLTRWDGVLDVMGVMTAGFFQAVWIGGAGAGARPAWHCALRGGSCAAARVRDHQRGSLAGPRVQGRAAASACKRRAGGRGGAPRQHLVGCGAAWTARERAGRRPAGRTATAWVRWGQKGCEVPLL
jgi:hypothetical protein